MPDESLVAALRLEQDCDALSLGRMYVGVKEVVVARVADHPGHGLANLTNLTNMGSRGSRQGRLKPQS